MSNRVLSVTFDKASLPLSPNCDFFVGEEKNGKVIFNALTSIGDLSDYTRTFKPDEQATVLNTSDEQFTLHVSLLQATQKFQIGFSILSQDGVQMKSRRFDARQYLEEFLEAAEASGLDDDQLIDTNFERKFSIAYLRNKLGDLIQANDKFWYRLSDDLDTVTAPINNAIMKDLVGDTLLPVFVRTGGQLLPAFTP